MADEGAREGGKVWIPLVSALAALAAGVGLGRQSALEFPPGPPAQTEDALAHMPVQPLQAPEPPPPPEPKPDTDTRAAPELDTPEAYALAYAQAESDPPARAEAALLMHYRYGPQRARLDEAKQLLEQLEAPAPRVAGLLALAEGELDAALEQLPPASEDPRAALYRAWAELERGELDAARAAAKLTLDARPEDRAAALVLLCADFAADHDAGLAALREAASARADHPLLADTLLHAQRALAGHGVDAELNTAEAARLRRRADTAYAEGRWLEAEQVLARAYASDESGLDRARGSGFPDFDLVREEVIFGRLLAAADPIAGIGRSHGPLELREGLLARVDPPPRKDQGSSFWLSSGTLASVSDGTVRFRVAPGRSADMGLMVRVQDPDPDPSWGLLSGYELSFTSKRVRLLRWDRGVAKSMVSSVALNGLSDMTHVEVVVYMLGPQLVATIYSGHKLELLATLSAHDTTYASGQVGYRAGVQQHGGGLEFVSVMDRARAEPSGLAERELHGRLYLDERVEDATPFGPRRYALVPTAQLDALPEDMRGPKQVKSEHEGMSLVELDAVEAERLRRSSVELRSIEGSAPWGRLHPEYLAERDQPPTPTARGFELGRSYKNPEMVEALLRGYQERYPDISELVELGRSHGGRPLLALEISAQPREREDKPSVLITGSFHGDELLSTEFALDAVASLLEGYGRVGQVTRWVDELEIWAVPMVNPDGAHSFLERSTWAGRKNGQDSDGDGRTDPFEGVDLNRNFPYGWGETGSKGDFTGESYRGPAPGSEPETQAIMQLASAEHFAAALSFHTLGRAIFVPYLVDHSSDMRPNVPKAIALELVAAAGPQREGRPYVVRPNGYAVAGCDQDWLMHEHGTAALLLEGAYQNPPLNIREEAVRTTRAVWETLLERVRAGPRISGHVRDPNGQPLEAVVRVAEHRMRAGERWAARARDGRFDRLLVEGGRYTLRVEAPGYESVEQVVRVGGGPVEVDFTLQPRGS